MINFFDAVHSLDLSHTDEQKLWDLIDGIEPVPLEVAAHLSARFCTSYTRMGLILSLRPLMRLPDWWTLLGGEWSGCDNIATFNDVLVPAHKDASVADLELMMTATAQIERAKLPPVLTVYRGCYAINRAGLSWSISRQLAASFPFLHRYSRLGDQPFLLTGEVSLDRTVLILDRNELEVVSPDVKVISEDPLREVTAP